MRTGSDRMFRKAILIVLSCFVCMLSPQCWQLLVGGSRIDTLVPSFI
jgi:hypothetical protein